MKCCVIGLGRFGFQMAVKLAENGVEVLAVDDDQKTVEAIRNKVTQAVCFRIEDEEALRAMGIEEMDTVVVAMGESFTQSIILTAILKKNLNIPYVISRARNKIHEDILKLTGADKVITPERDSGVRFANSLSLKFSDYIPVSDNFAITHVKAPESFVGKTIAELQLRKSRNVACIAIKKEDNADMVNLVGLEYVITEEDIMVLCGSNKHLARVNEW